MAQWPLDVGNDACPAKASDMSFTLVSEADSQQPLWSQDSSICSADPIKDKGYESVSVIFKSNHIVLSPGCCVARLASDDWAVIVLLSMFQDLEGDPSMLAKSGRCIQFAWKTITEFVPKNVLEARLFQRACAC
jgi:hypothetical protein